MPGGAETSDLKRVSVTDAAPALATLAEGPTERRWKARLGRDGGSQLAYPPR